LGHIRLFGIKLGRPNEPINRLHHHQSNIHNTIHKNIGAILREFQAKKECYSSGVLGSPTCAELGLSQTITVGLLYPGGDKSREGLLHRSLSFANCSGLESP
jgi:hypothetical protein